LKLTDRRISFGWYVRKVEQNHIREGFYIGVLGLVLNWALYIATLVPMNDMAVGIFYENRSALPDHAHRRHCRHLHCHRRGVTTAE
jgi:hypothetical protein